MINIKTKKRINILLEFEINTDVLEHIEDNLLLGLVQNERQNYNLLQIILIFIRVKKFFKTII